MATRTAKKKTSKTKAPRAAKKSARRSPGRSASRASRSADELSDADRARLEALDGERHDRDLDRAVADMMLESQRLSKAAARDRRRLTQLGLAAGAHDDLKDRHGLFERAEGSWSAARAPGIPALKAARREAEALKTELLAALRFQFERNRLPTDALDAIVEGSGDADTIDDLKKLAALATKHAELLAQTDLEGDPAKRALVAARALEDVASDDPKPELTAARRLRDRAFWHLRHLMDEIRQVGRYAFRNDPAKREQYYSTATLARADRLRRQPRPRKKPGSDGSPA